MGILTEGRITPASLYLLAQLAEPDAFVVFVTTREGGDPRFYFQQGLAHRLVPERSVDVLAQRGYIIRGSSPVPIYRITDKGRAYLKG